MRAWRWVKRMLQESSMRMDERLNLDQSGLVRDSDCQKPSMTG